MTVGCTYIGSCIVEKLGILNSNFFYTMVLAKDLSHHFSEEAKSRQPSQLKSMLMYRSVPGMRSLGGGLPVPALFPFDDVKAESLSYPFTKGISMESYGEAPTLGIDIIKSQADENYEDIPLSVSLQYGSSMGEPKLREFIKEHIRRAHNIKFDDWDVILSIGNTFSWDATLRTFCNRGDVILAEEFSFTSALEAVHSLGITSVGVKMDLEGIIPEALEAQLEAWVGPRPKLLYTIPTGQNPTGSSLSAERREKIYKIAQKYDFLIIEDEPYYYLQFPEYSYEKSRSPKEEITDKALLASETDKMIKNFAPSFFEYDTDGRVIRLDSFSKVIAPGTRLSWVVAQNAMIERYMRITEVTIQNASGFSSSIVYGLLRRWGQEGYWSWLYKLKDVYTHFRDIACDTIIENFPEGRYSFVPPVAGMFFWIKVDSRRYKEFNENKRDTIKCELDLWQKAIESKVLIVPGHWFLVSGQTVPPQKEITETEDEKYAMYFRGTFAGVSEEVLRSALRDFGLLLKTELSDSFQ